MTHTILAYRDAALAWDGEGPEPGPIRLHFRLTGQSRPATWDDPGDDAEWEEKGWPADATPAEIARWTAQVQDALPEAEADERADAAEYRAEMRRENATC